MTGVDPIEQLIVGAGEFVVPGDGFTARTLGQIEQRRGGRRMRMSTAAALFLGFMATSLPVRTAINSCRQNILPATGPAVSLTVRAAEQIGGRGEQLGWEVAETVSRRRAGDRGLRWDEGRP